MGLSEINFQDPEFYLKRYIVSRCMSFSEVHFTKDVAKGPNWKKSDLRQIRISPENIKNIEVSPDILYQGLQDVTRGASKDETEIQYLLLTFSNDVSIAITESPVFLDMFEAACCLILEKNLERVVSLVGDKLETFSTMVLKTKTFLESTAGQTEKVPPVPKAPPPIDLKKAFAKL